MQFIALLSLCNRNNGVAKEVLPAAEPLCKCTVIPSLLNSMPGKYSLYTKILFTKETLISPFKVSSYRCLREVVKRGIRNNGIAK